MELWVCDLKRMSAQSMSGGLLVKDTQDEKIQCSASEEFENFAVGELKALVVTDFEAAAGMEGFCPLQGWWKEVVVLGCLFLGCRDLAKQEES